MKITNPVKLILLLLVLLVFVLLNCTQGVSGVETTNGFTVVATSVTIEGSAPPYSQVFLFDTSYIPYIDSGIGLGTSVGLDSNYQFYAAPGTYNILVLHSEGIEAGVLRETVNLNEQVAPNPQSQTLQKTGSITGSVATTSSDRFLIYLAGMGYYRILSGSANFTFYTIPSGTYQLRVARLIDSTSSSVEIVKSVEVIVRADAEVLAGEISLD